jgi:cytochrome P450
VQAALARVDEFDDVVRTLIRERRAEIDRPADLLTGLVESVDDAGMPLSEDKISRPSRTSSSVAPRRRPI